MLHQILIHKLVKREVVEVKIIGIPKDFQLQLLMHNFRDSLLKNAQLMLFILLKLKHLKIWLIEQMVKVNISMLILKMHLIN